MEQETLFPEKDIKEEVDCLYDTVQCFAECQGCKKFAGEKNIKKEITASIKPIKKFLLRKI